MGEVKTTMSGVIEREEGMDVLLVENADGIFIRAFCECGYNHTNVDLKTLVAWIKANRPELLG